MIRIVTDSVAGIPADVARENGIQVVSLFINEGSLCHQESIMDIEGFYGRIQEMIDDIPTSSQPSQAELEAVFEEAALAGDEVLGIFLSSQLSGTFEGAVTAARSVGARKANLRYCLIDSLSVGFDEGFCVLQAAAARDAGCTLEQCRQVVETSISCSRIIFTPESLDFLQAGGRIGAASALLGSLMKLCPIMTVTDGVVNVLGKVRTHRKAVSAIAERFKEDIEAYGFKNAVVHYIGCAEEALAWAREVVEPLCQQAVAVIPVSPVIGVHVGPAIGMSYECERPLPDKLTPGMEIPVYCS